MNEQQPPIIQVTSTQTGISSNISPKLDSGRKISNTIPWSGYFVTYFIQGTIMPMVLIQVSVYLVQCLGLDWIMVTGVFIIIIMPVFLRPAFAAITDRRPTMLSPMLLIGGILVVTGSILAGLGTLERTSGLTIFTIGFSAGAAGATILNVVTDSHIIRAISLGRSAKVNSYKKIFSFLGGAVIQIAYIFLVGSNLSDSFAWARYFSLPAIITVVVLFFTFLQKKSWRILPEVTGLPPIGEQWLEKKSNDSIIAKTKLIPVILLAGIMFLFFFPDGLLETTWENYIVKSYGELAWAVYNGLIILFGIVSVVGFLLARRSGKRVPEWDLLWYTPLMLGYYVMILLNPPFPVLVSVSLGIQIPFAYIQVRLLQSMQTHSYSKKAGQTFQIFMVLLQGGKFVGISISGVTMTAGGYPGIFMVTILILLIMLSFITIYWIITRSSKSSSTR